MFILHNIIKRCLIKKNYCKLYCNIFFECYNKKCFLKSKLRQNTQTQLQEIELLRSEINTLEIKLSKDNDEWKVDALTNDQIKKIQGMI